MDMSGVDTEREIEEREAWERRRRRFGLAAAPSLIVFACAAAVALLPRIASLPAVRERILERVNDAVVPASVAVDDWTLRWLGGQRLEGARLSDPSRGVSISIQSVTVSSGLVKLLPFGTVDAGVVTLDRPIARLARPSPRAQAAAPDAAPDAAPTASGTAAASRTAPSDTPPPQPFELPRITPHAELVVRNGSVLAGDADEEAGVLAEQISGALQLRAWDQPMAFRADGTVPSGAGDGAVRVTGELPPPRTLAARAFDDPACAGRATISLRGFDLRALRPLAAARTGAAWIEQGIANLELSARVAGLRETAVDADLAVARLSLAAPGGSPPSPPGDVTLTLSAHRNAQGVIIRSCEARTPWARASAEGRFDIAATGAAPIGRIAVTGAVDLASVARDFRPLLRLDPAVRVERGTLAFAGTVAGNDRARTLQLDAVAEECAVFYNDERVRLTPPPRVALGLVVPYTEPPELTTLDVVLPFARVSGSGRLDRGTVSGQVDLTAFSRDYRKLVTACPPMVGEILFQVNAAQNGLRSRIQAAVGVEDLAAEVAAGKRIVIRRADSLLAFNVPLELGRPLPEASDVRLACAFDGGTVSGSVARVVLPGRKRELDVDGLAAAVELDLRETLASLRPVLPLPAGAALGGRLFVNLTAEASGGVALGRFTSAASGLALRTTAWDANERDARAEGAVELNTAQGAVKLSDWKLTTSAARLSVPRLHLVLPGEGRAAAIGGEAVAEADLGVLSGWRRPPRDGAAPTRLDGRARLRVTADPAANGTRLAAEAALADLEIRAGAGATPVREKQVTARAAARLSPDGESLAVESAEVTAGWLGVTAKGRVSDLAGAARASLTGTVAVDYDALSARLAASGMRVVTLAGKPGPRPFAFSGSLSGGIAALRSFGAVEGALGVGEIGVLGLKLATADASFAMDEGLLTLDYQPASGAGAVRLKPLLQAAADPPVLELGGATPLLDRVPLTQAFTDTVLALVNPLLRGCATGDGMVSLALAETRVPLGADMGRRLDTTFAITLHGARFEPVGPLAEALDLVGIERRTLVIRETAIRAVCRDGRITPEPFELTLDGHALRFRGSVGLDQTVSYLVELPLTEKLVGRSAWPHLKGLTVRVPVTGTLTNLRLDREAGKREIGRLLKEAAVKAISDTAVERLNQILRDR